MSVSTEEFWSLAAGSGLLPEPLFSQTRSEFSQVNGAVRGNAQALAAWLVDRGKITTYQSRVLLAGRNGPFQYGPYRILHRENQGWLAGMFRAVHQPTGQPVLLQFLAGDFLRDQQCWTEVATRTLHWGRMINRYLVRYHHAQDLRRFRFLVLEDLQGETLAERLHRGPLNVEQAAHVGRLVALGLGVLHQGGEAFGILSPRSVWLSRDGNVKLIPSPTLDPDAADDDSPRGAEPRPDMTDYLAPELQDRGRNSQGDIYALGCLLYEALAGFPPFVGGNRHQRRQRHLQEPVRPLRDVAEGFQQIIVQLMAKQPSERITTAVAASELLRRWTPTDLQNYRPPSPSAGQLSLERWIREHPTSSLAAVESGSPCKDAPVIAAPLGRQPQTIAEAPQSHPWEATPPAAPSQPSQAMASASLEGPTPAIVTDNADVNAAGPRPARRSAKSRLRGLLTQIAMAGGAALIIGGLGYLLSVNRDAAKDPPKRRAPSDPIVAVPGGPSDPRLGVNPGGAIDGEQSASATQGNSTWTVLPQDDGRTLWAPPTDGPPLDLRMIPLEMLALVAMRPAEILADDEGRRLWRALGPRFEELAAQWQAGSSIPWEQARQVVMTLHPNGEQFPQPAFVITLTEPTPREEVLRRWPGSRAEPQADSGATIVEAAKWAYYVPQGELVATFAMAAPQLVREIAELQGTAPPMRGVVAKLLQFSDSDRLLNIIATPHDLSSVFFRDGRSFYFGPAMRVREPMQWLLGERLQAVLFSAHVDQQSCYLELRLAAELGLDRFTLAEQLRERMNQAPGMMQTYLAQQINPPVFWRQVAFQVPSMIRFLHRHTRIQAEDAYAVVNASLPREAAHNLVFSGEMLLSSSPSPPPIVAAPTPTSGPATIDELLQTKTTISFPQLALDFALATISDDVKDSHPRLAFPFEIKILGGDLEAGGITQNQQIRGFQQVDQTIATILTAMMVQANPNPSSTGPADERQSLVWVVGPDPDNDSRKIILITTRDAAAAKNYALPAAFGQP